MIRQHPALLFFVGFSGHLYCHARNMILHEETAGDYFIAGCTLPMWIFILAATATSFSGWTFIGHPGSIYAGGLPYAFAGFYAITIPFTGMLFLKGQWVLGKKFGFITPGEMYSAYYCKEQHPKVLYGQMSCIMKHDFVKRNDT